MEESPTVTPRSVQAPPSEEDEAQTQDQSEEVEPEQPKRKKTGDEPPTRQHSPKDPFAVEDIVEEEEQEEEERVQAYSNETAEDDIASGQFMKIVHAGFQAYAHLICRDQMCSQFMNCACKVC